MTQQVKLKVGYIGKTREGNRVVAERESNGIFFCSDGLWRSGNGANLAGQNTHIIGPWTDDATEYETGVWYGWNGGECPVHPEAKVDVKLRDGEEYYRRNARFWTWNDDHDGTIIAFRIVTPYVEPEPKLECWMNVDMDGSMFGYSTKGEADKNIHSDHIRCVRMIEADDQ